MEFNKFYKGSELKLSIWVKQSTFYIMLHVIILGYQK